MKAFLLHPDRDFDPAQAVSPNATDLTQDLGLDTLIEAMGAGDPFLVNIARTAILSGLPNDSDAILYRQAILHDCLQNPAVVRQLYDLTVEAWERKRRNYFGYISLYPSSVLSGSVGVLDMLVEILAKLKAIAEGEASRFVSRGFSRFFAMLREELSDNYFALMREQLRELQFKNGVMLSAQLGRGNEGSNYVLRRPHETKRNWLERLLQKGPPRFTFRIHERDEAGARALSELRNRGLNLVANAVAQATDHIVSFFDLLRTELAFYVSCLNLYDRLAAMGAPVCLPRPDTAGSRSLSFRELYDVALALSLGHRAVGNTINADHAAVVIITGANQGGKSTFLRAIGLAQLMMQCGMFVGAESFAGELCSGLFTHFKRQEDATMTKGKLDEELSRMDGIVAGLAPNAIVLFNESFAATNEREGSEIARQIVSALREARIKTFYVTHLYDFAHGLFSRGLPDALFLLAERRPDGERTFRLIPGEPLETSYGKDVYEAVFGVASGAED